MLKKKFFIYIVISVFLISIFSACGNKNDLSKIVLTVGDEKVPLNEAMLYLRITEKEFENKGGKDIWKTPFDGRTAEEVAKERTMESIIQVKVLKQKAKEMNINLTDEEVKKAEGQVEKIIKYLGEDVFDNINIPQKTIKDIIKESMLSSKVFEKIAFTPNEDEVNKKVEKILGEIKNKDPEEILLKAKIKNISILTHKKENNKWVPLSKEQQTTAKTKADEILKSAKGGDDFVMLVKKYSEDTATKEKDRDKILQRGKKDPVAEVAFKLQPGEISEIITTEYGYEIIKLEEFIKPTKEEIENYKKQLKQYEEQLKQQYILQQKQEAFNKKYKEWKNNNNIKINHKIWDKVHVLNFKKLK